jgi:hypothetical protein
VLRRTRAYDEGRTRSAEALAVFHKEILRIAESEAARRGGEQKDEDMNEEGTLMNHRWLWIYRRAVPIVTSN